MNAKNLCSRMPFTSDSSITPANIQAILARNDALKLAIDQNPNVVEVTRLVEKHFTEEDISKRKFGISYRVGCAPDLIPLVKW